jgi:prepilin-type N-terminal cleavage/methylation domain-containing protein
MQLRRGFSLVEMAVVLAIVAMLLGGIIMTLSTQEEARNAAETRRRLEAAADAVIGFAIANRRLPCPASGATGTESLASGTTAAGGACSSNFGGFLPGASVGFQPVDAQGFAVDAWGNRIRYAVASAITGCTGSSTTPHFTSVANLKANGVSCRPNDLVICGSSTGTNPGASPPSCGAAQAVTNQETVAFVLHSAGKNGIGGAATGADETANANGDAVFIYREHGTLETNTGIYDDMLHWAPAGVLYSKLIAAGVLP